MLAHRWLITLVHRLPTVNGSQVAQYVLHRQHVISATRVVSSRCFFLGTFATIDILHKGSLFYLL